MQLITFAKLLSQRALDEKRIKCSGKKRRPYWQNILKLFHEALTAAKKTSEIKRLNFCRRKHIYSSRYSLIYMA